MTALTVENLRIDVPGGPAVAGLDLAIGRGRVFCLVGESGCGKSLTALALMGLLPAGARGGIRHRQHRRPGRSGRAAPPRPDSP